MTLEDFTIYVESKFNSLFADNAPQNDELDLTAKYLLMTGITSLHENKIEDLLAAIQDADAKEAMLDQLAWGIPGGSAFKNLDVNKDCKITVDDDTNKDDIIDDKDFEEPEYESVDLGLTSGTLWATKNVGANAVTDFGLYFAWGETEGYGIIKDANDEWKIDGDKRFDWDEGENDYKFTEPNGFNLDDTPDYGISKYNVTDRKTVLNSEDDATTVAMGGLWHMPSTAQFQELADECYWEWTNSYNNLNVSGYIVYKVKDEADKGKKKYSDGGDTPVESYSLSDAHIFLPTAGYCGDGYTDIGNKGSYWSRSLLTDSIQDTLTLSFNKTYINTNDNYTRYQGLTVRGVIG